MQLHPGPGGAPGSGRGLMTLPGTPAIPEELDGGSLEAAPRQEHLDALDRRLLSVVQSGFPLEPRPYTLLGEALGLTEAETLARVRALRAKGIIRRLGANFQSSGLGFHSTLCAAAVPEDRLEAFITLVNQQPGVTHNYLREHTYNIWFTLIAPSKEKALAEIANMEEASGLRILNLPAEKLYKIKVDFDMEE